MSSTLPAYSHSDCGWSRIVSMLRSSSAGQAAMAGKVSKASARLVRKRRIRLKRLERGRKVLFDALERGMAVGFEADHDHRGRVGGAGEPEAVSILHAHAVDGEHAHRSRERLRGLQLFDQPMGLAFFEL